MKRNPDYLLDRDGRFFARMVVPKNLRPHLGGRTELRRPLGPDRRDAMRNLHGAVASIQQELAQARRAFDIANGREVEQPAPYPLTAEEIARRAYRSLIDFDSQIRVHDHRFAHSEIDEQDVRTLRDGVAGRLSDAELEAIVGERIERYRFRGNTSVRKGTPEWRDLAMKLCVSEYEALARHAERNEGDFTGTPAHPLLANAMDDVEPEIPPLSLKGLLEDYLTTQGRIGRGREAGRR